MTITSFLTSFSLLAVVFGDQDFAQVVQADKLLNRFIMEHKVDAAAEIYSDDFILTTSSGSVKKKNDILKEIGLTDLQFEINETTEVHVRLVGNTAVLTGMLHQKGVYKGNSFESQFLVTDTWVLINGRWRLLAGHATLIKTS